MKEVLRVVARRMDAAIARQARLDMSYHGRPLVYLPPGARPGENLRRGDISIRHNDTVHETLSSGR